MTQFFYKTGFLSAVFVTVAVIFSLCGTAVLHSRQKEKILPVLSEKYEIVYQLDGRDVEIKRFADICKKSEGTMTAGVRLSDETGCAVYSVDGRLDDLELEEGRVFTSDDYDKGADVILLRADMLPLCGMHQGKRVFHYLDSDYLVVGVYRDADYKSVTSSRYILNLYAESLQQSGRWKAGFLDGADGKTKQYFTDADMEMIPFSSDRGDVFGNEVSNLKGMILLYLAAAMMILLNVFMAADVWLKGRKKEIAVRMMAGAARLQIGKWLTGNFMCLVCLCLLAATGFVRGILFVINTWDISPSMVMMFGDRMEWQGILAAAVLELLIGLAVILVELYRYFKREIIEIIRSE